MKKFIFILSLIASLAGTAFYFQDDLAAAISPNDKNVVAKQWWITQKNAVSSQKNILIPVSGSVKNIDFSFGADQLQDGKYYLDTTMYINGRYALPLYTVIEPIDGQWTVNVEETFSSVPDAALNRFTNSFSNAILTANDFVTLPLFKGLPREADQAQKEAVSSYIDEQFSVAKQAFLNTYLNRKATQGP